jgi:SAM-dependent methyltransferase
MHVPSSISEFYDELAPVYHILFQDWDLGMERQGRELAGVIPEHWPNARRVLDVSCGIGIQSIALAAHGYLVTGSDLSPKAVARAGKEARKRGLEISFSVCDMLGAHAHHGGGFDLVVSCDNALPHLLSDEEICAALKQMFACARPGGGCLVTIRDYEPELRGKNILKPYGVRVEGGHRFVVFQVWDFEGDFYDLTVYFVREDLRSKVVTTQAMRSRYYAISVTKMMRLMTEAGFCSVKRVDGAHSLPILLGSRPA